MVKPLAQRALVLAALLVTLAGCGLTTPPGSFAPHKEIEAIGVVASQKVAAVEAGVEYTWTFDDGRTYALTFEGTGAAAAAGTLLIAGSKPRPWTLIGSPQDPDSGWPKGCYKTMDYTVEEHDTTVDLDIGVTLQKAPDYQPSLRSLGERWRAEMCLDREGRVMKLYGGGA